MASPVVILQETQEEEIEAVEEEVAEEVNNPILPTGPELIWGAGTFVILWVLMKYLLLPPITKLMDERDAKVRTDLEGADAARGQREALIAEYDAALAAARAEATRIVEDARAQADAQRAELIGAAEAEVAAARAAAAAEVNAAKEAAMADLRGQVAGIATAAAEAVVQRQLDASAQQLIDQYLSQSGSQN